MYYWPVMCQALYWVGYMDECQPGRELESISCIWTRTSTGKGLKTQVTLNWCSIDSVLSIMECGQENIVLDNCLGLQMFPGSCILRVGYSSTYLCAENLPKGATGLRAKQNLNSTKHIHAYRNLRLKERKSSMGHEYWVLAHVGSSSSLLFL